MQTLVQNSLFPWSDPTRYLSARKTHHYQAEIYVKCIELHITEHYSFKVIPGKKGTKTQKPCWYYTLTTTGNFLSRFMHGLNFGVGLQ